MNETKRRIIDIFITRYIFVVPIKLFHQRIRAKDLTKEGNLLKFFVESIFNFPVVYANECCSVRIFSRHCQEVGELNLARLRAVIVKTIAKRFALALSFRVFCISDVPMCVCMRVCVCDKTIAARP